MSEQQNPDNVRASAAVLRARTTNAMPSRPVSLMPRGSRLSETQQEKERRREGETHRDLKPGSIMLVNDVSVDGKRFLMLKVDRSSTSAQLTVVLNWFEELKARVVPAR
jgi:hypothetical protein